MYHTWIFLVLSLVTTCTALGSLPQNVLSLQSCFLSWNIDPQVAFNMLHLCSGFCKIVHLATSTPPSVAADSLKIMDSDVRSCFSKCFSIDLSEAAWCQSQLSLRFGGLGLCSLSHHSSAEFIASFCSSGFATTDNHHLMKQLISSTA